jgi:hypothetical protein
LNVAAKEALLVALYRMDRPTKQELSLALGIDRFETNEVLTKYNVAEDLATPEEIADDLKTITKLACE